VTAGEGPGAVARLYAGAGIRVLPIKPGTKRPPLNGWQKIATTDPATIDEWWGNGYADHGVGLAMGLQPDGRRLFALDVDEHDPAASGGDTLRELEHRYGYLPATVQAITGNGGLHYIYDSGDQIVTNGAANQLGPGLDVRGEGGQIVVEPSIHPNGAPYTWEDGYAPWEHEIAPAPAWLLELLAPPAPVVPPTSSPPSSMSADTPADALRARWDWAVELVNRGWTLESTSNGDSQWTRPGKDARDGASAVLHGKDGPLVVFTTNAQARALWATGKVSADGSCVSLTPLQFYAASDYGSDLSAASAAIRATMPAPDLASLIAPDADPVAGSTIGLETVTHDIALNGAAFILDESVELEARWGTGADVLWARGESMVVAAPPGVGKTTIAAQLVAALIGILPDVLGYDVTPARRVLYLAMDRPRQIRRALKRLFHEAHRGALAERLIVRPGPLPADLGKRPEQLLELARLYGCDVIVIDSLKDAAVKLTDDEVGGNVNRAIQHCNAADIDVLVLHHQRKGVGGEKPTKLEDVYGSTWITAGAGSVFLLWGEAGSELVELSHLKQPADPVGPFTVEHDHHQGTSTIAHGFDCLAFLRIQGEAGCTVAQAAQAEHGGPQAPGNAKWKKTERRLRALVKAGLARKDDRPKVGEPGLYHAVEVSNLDSLAMDNPVGHGVVVHNLDAPVDTPLTTMDTQHETPGHAMDTPMDTPTAVTPWTSAGGSISPAESSDPLEQSPSQPDREPLL
jgi:hypothetical protein